MFIDELIQQCNKKLEEFVSSQGFCDFKIEEYTHCKAVSATAERELRQQLLTLNRLKFMENYPEATLSNGSLDAHHETLFILSLNGGEA